MNTVNNVDVYKQKKIYISCDAEKGCCKDE